ncbi:MAG TPA: 16S rRNA (adenine(1518)-N(6)/adenine(1519)-N(6))-dimethyltransferase RsmA [Candidatus Paceibacterota bacterium]|nr:16S rRNA (adenine(1518)-N(6)/adenine(1519)-N(6))-dimethyltransferase RsmA [Candidatus Paceibacterota bacterium]
MTSIAAKKSLGQNFLINPGVAERIIEAAELTPSDSVLEIGPGTGLLTRLLAQQAGAVIAVEKDRRLIETLRQEFENSPVRIIEGDALEFSPAEYSLAPGNYKIVANLPYYITGRFLKTVFEKWPRPNLLVIMVQKEVAQRIQARPPHMNLLAAAVQYYAEPETIMQVSAGSFRPIPAVDSAVVRLRPWPELGPNFLALARIGFSSKRKQLLSNLSERFDKEIILSAFEKVGLLPTVRAENLSVTQWQQLARNLSTH